MKRGDRARAWAVVAAIAIAVVAWTPIGDWAWLAFAPAIDALHAPLRWAHRAADWFSDRNALIHRLHELERRNAELQARRLQLQAAQTQLAQLRALLGVAKSFGTHWAAARIVSISPDAAGRRLLLDAPRAAKGDIVVAADGLVGIVDRVAAGKAIVRTILDASLAVPAVDHSGKRALLVRGQGDRLRVDFALADDPLKPGDILFSSGAGGVFPPGLPLARIVRVQHRPGDLFLQIEAEPAARWRTQAYLAIVPRAAR